MRRVNLHSLKPEYDESDPDGYRAGMARFGKELGAVMIGGSVYELPPGQSNCPYHYEYGNEEWLIVLAGAPDPPPSRRRGRARPGRRRLLPRRARRRPQADQQGDEIVRVLMLSTTIEPAVAVYPDSDKIGVWPDPDRRDHILVRRESGVDYWDGEV